MSPHHHNRTGDHQTLGTRQNQDNTTQTHELSIIQI